MFVLIQDDLFSRDPLQGDRSKRERGNRKGNLSKLANHFHSIEDVPLAEQDILDLERWLEAVEENIAAFTMIHQRLLEVIKSEALPTEEEEVTEQQKQNNELLAAYQIPIGACQTWAAGDCLNDDGQDLMERSSLAGTYSRQSYEHLIYDYKEFRQTIKKFPKYKDLRTLKDKLSPMLHTLSERADKDVDGSSTAGSVASDHSASPVVITDSKRSRLRLELPTFLGDILQWKEFRDLFNPLIKRESLEEREKITHLITALLDSESKSIARHASSKGSYSKVVTAPKQRYDKKRVVYMIHVVALLARKPITCHHEDISQCKLDLDMHLDSLLACEGGTAEQLVVAMTTLLMDPDLSQQWALSVSDCESPPGADELRAFLEQQITAHQTNPYSSKKKPTCSTPLLQTPSKPRERSRPAILNVRESTSDSCPSCNGAHKIYLRDAFKSWTLEKRTSTAKKKGLCLNCLGKGHAIESCTSLRVLWSTSHSSA